MCEISFEPTLNGGRGGQKDKAGASLSKDLQVKNLAVKSDFGESRPELSAKLAKQNSSKEAKRGSDGLFSKDEGKPSQRGDRENSVKYREKTLDQNDNGDIENRQKYSKEKVAEKLALLGGDESCPNKKLTDQNNNFGGIKIGLENRDGPITPTSEYEFAKINQKGFLSKNYAQNAAGKSCSFVDLIGKKEEMLREINGRKSFVPPSLTGIFRENDRESLENNVQVKLSGFGNFDLPDLIS